MDTQIVRAIWERSSAPDHSPYMGRLDRNNHDHYSETRVFSETGLDSKVYKTPGLDQFFTPLWFRGRRLNSNVAPPGVLFADLDNVKDLTDALHKMWPHVLWLTSDNNAQAVWFLDAPVADLDAWHDLNQRMTYFMGADKGGWHASKLLRVPGTHNYKYDPPQQGVVWSFQPKAEPYSAEALRASLPTLSNATRLSGEAPKPIAEHNWKPFLATIWDRLPLRTRTDLLADGMPDRSVALVRASNKMRMVGIPPEDQFQALWWVAWNKFRTDRNRPDLLWEIVTYEG